MKDANKTAVAAADRIHSAAIHLLRSVRREDEAAGVPPGQLSALSLLTFRGPITIGQVAAMEEVSSPTISRIVDGLERAGLARRKPNSSDGRSVYVDATPRGRRVLLRARARRVDALATSFSELSAAELGVIEEAARLIEEALTRNAEGSVGSGRPQRGHTREVAQALAARSAADGGF